MTTGERDAGADAATSQPQRLLRRGVSRRGFLAGVAGFSMLGLLAACGGDDDDDAADSPTATTGAAAATEPAAEATTATEEPAATEPAAAATEPAAVATEPASAASPTTEAAASPSADGPWEFTDGRGITVSLPKRPERIVTFAPAAGALWDFGIRPVGIYGVQTLADGTKEPTVGNADLDTMTSLSETNEDIEAEALLALQPDLVITTLNTDKVPWGMQDPATQALIAAICPVIGMPAFFEPIDALIGHFEELAIALGGDPTTAEAQELRTAFDDASETIRTITAEKPELTVMVCSGNADNFFFASTELFPDLIYLTDLGVQFVRPDASIEFDGPWAFTSWEQVGQYTPDAVLADSRRGWPPTAFEGKATYENLAAVQAGQVGKWTPIVPLSYGGMAQVLTIHAELLGSADQDIA